ncbi:MAG TPA: SLBB domain-containing protein [Leptolyngbyaceae cyanobacterium M33_DOE_097]|uniref:Sugar ABC transporter substrate-binding protein n=1 Tax=Oscillatoriales cyanobacterium SpSt-418 TaxID=2282169 RepID=A0A7C3KHX8_9CYAN|nr:SLBB domain-containing protein [Leptolyngbyaceae cyanobacterium M33_DOE_097]
MQHDHDYSLIISNLANPASRLLGRRCQRSVALPLGLASSLFISSFATLITATTLLQWATPAAIAQASPPAPGGSSQIDTDDYLLGAGDRLKIDFLTIPEFTAEYQVLPSGAVNLPLIGSIPVKGRTIEQATNLLSQRYAAVVQRPAINITLLAARPVRIAIAGEVNRPGSYTITTPITNGETPVPTISRTIQLAEGLTQSADLRQVQIRRAAPLGGTPQLFTVNLWDLVQTGDLAQDLQLRDGDSVFIPATTTVNLAEARQLSNANLAARNNRPLKITVVGEVYRPGPYTLIEGAVSQRDQLINPNLLQVPSVTRAIQVAGGITQLADIRNIQVRRLTRSGPTQTITLNFWQLLKEGDGLQDLPLQDGDTIEIPKVENINEGEISELATASFSPEKITINVVGEVERPGAILVSPNTPLNQAILSAGGFNLKAKKGSVTLIRLNPNGTVVKRDVEIDLAQAANENSNPPLRNNDIVVVKKNGLSTVTDAAAAILSPLGGALGILRIFGF